VSNNELTQSEIGKSIVSLDFLGFGFLDDRDLILYDEPHLPRRHFAYMKGG